MCRNIRQLHNFDPPATDDYVDIVRSPIHPPHEEQSPWPTSPPRSHRTLAASPNEAVFERAVREIAHISRHLLDDLVTTAPPRDRDVEAARAKARAAKRFGAAA